MPATKEKRGGKIKSAKLSSSGPATQSIKRRPPSPSISLSRKTQSRYIFMVGGWLFLYSIVLIVLSFGLQQSALGDGGFTVNIENERQVMSFLFVLVIAFLFSVLFAMIFVHQFFHPFFQIRDKLRRMLERNLTTRLELSDNDEFKALSKEFNHVLDQLERLVLVLRLEQEEVSMILMKARRETHMQSTRDTLDRISKHNERIIQHLLSFRVLGDK